MPQKPTRAELGLWPQFVHHSPRYLVGVGLLGLYELAPYWFDTRLRDAINPTLGGAQDLARDLGLQLIVVVLVAFVVRVLSRVVVFNAGRNAEYDIRGQLEEHLLRLGPSLYG